MIIKFVHLVAAGWLTRLQGRRNGFQGGGAMEHWQVLPATMVGQLEKFLNSRRSRMAKTVTFWPWWQPFNSFCFESLSFFPLFPFFLFATQKSGGGGMGGGWAWPPRPSSITGPGLDIQFYREGTLTT